MSEAPEASPPAGYVQTVYGFDRPQSTSGEDVFPQALVESPSGAAIDPNSASVQVMETAPVDILPPYVDAAAPGLPGGTFGDPVNRAPVVFGVSPVAGASTWARLLGLVEVFTFEAVVQAASSGVPVVLVCRSTESSVATCFDAIAASRGQVRIAAVVVIPDAPGAVIRSVQHRLKILGSSHRLVQVPWVKALRAVGLDRITDEIRLSKPVARAVSKVSTALELGAVGKEKV
ncbi:hypothetical protein [Rothia dentocariosa]|uniref:hypothetical protein n=1 Tax=Rothia dentocariosa TaxID=2047 RepID=UPI0028E72447|nr:hypothetical protein [Rothia dentocariosa]